MPLAKNPAAYVHVKQILDAAISLPRSIFTLPSPEAATRWRQEAYYFRKLSGDPRYGDLILKLDGSKVIIERRAVVGVLTTEDGTRIDLTPEIERDAFEEAAKKLAKELGLEIADEDL